MHDVYDSQIVEKSPWNLIHIELQNQVIGGDKIGFQFNSYWYNNIQRLKFLKIYFEIKGRKKRMSLFNNYLKTFGGRIYKVVLYEMSIFEI